MNTLTKNQHFEIYQRVTEAIQQGRYSEALEQCDQLLRDNKKNVFLVCFQGFILNELNRRTKAQDCFKAALELVRLGQASDFMVESDRLLAQMVIEKLIIFQETLIRTELLSSKTEEASLYKNRLEKAKALQLKILQKLFGYLIPDDYKELYKLSKRTNTGCNSLIKEAIVKVQNLEEKLNIPHPVFNQSKIEKTLMKLKKVEKIMTALQQEINSIHKEIINMRISELNALLKGS